MPGIFEITRTDIERLEALPLTELTKRLVSLEAVKQCISQSGITCNLQITTPDGGEDICLESQTDPISKDWLPNRNTLIQCKATKVSKKSAANEVLTNKKKDAIKPRVDAVLSAGGSYVICTTHNIANPTKIDIIESIRQSFRLFSKAYADTVEIRIYDSNKLADWSNKFISVIASIRAQIGPTLPAMLKPWKEWQEYSDYQMPFVADDTLKNHINSLRVHLASHKAVARIVGLSGIGKTRLALETFRPPAETRDNPTQFALSSNSVYTDAEQTPNIVGLVSEWIRQEIEGVIIVDNCDSNLHTQLNNEVTRTTSNLSLLTLDYRINECSYSHPYIELNKVADPVITEILRQSYPSLPATDISRIVTIAEGFPRMAVLFAKANIAKEEHIGYLTDQKLIERLLWQDSQPNDAARKTIEACSLFSHLGFEDKFATQRIFVAEQICRIDKDDFYAQAVCYIRHGVLDRQGRFIKVVPFPLALTLAANWWRNCSVDRAVALINNVPLDMAQALYDQLRYLQFVPRAKEITAELVGDNGPFGHAEVLLTTQGSRLFRCLVEINPEPCLKALAGAIGHLSHQDLLELKPARRNIVWSLENLCFWNDTFPDATRLMLSLAAAENETWANNATNQFLQLFHICLSGTQAPPSSRLEIVDEILAEGPEEKKTLVVRALGRALKMHHFMRHAGPDQQGSRSPQQDWQPKSQDEMFDYQDACIQRLTKIACGQDIALAFIAKKEFGTRIRGLMSNCREPTIADAIKQIGQASKGYWPEAASDLRDILQYEGPEMEEASRQQVTLWLTWLQPSGLEDRLRMIVCTPSYEHSKDDQGRFRDIAEENAVLLAKELAPTIEQLYPFLSMLMSGEQRQAYSFGKELARLVSAPKLLANRMVEALRSTPEDKGNPSLLCGFLAAQQDRELVTEVLVKANNDPALNKYFVELTRLSKPTPIDLERVVNAFKEGHVPIDRLYAFSVNSVVDHLTPDLVVVFCDRIAAISLEGVACAMHILYMYCLLEGDRSKTCRPVFRRYMLTSGLLVVVNNRPGFCGHGWQEVAKHLLSGPDRDDDLAACIAKDITHACSQDNFPFDAKYYVSPVLELLLEKYFTQVWAPIGDAILSTDWRTRFHFGQLFDELGDKLKTGQVLTKAPLDLLTAWCQNHKPDGARSLARCLPVIQQETKEGPYTWHPYALAFIDSFGNDEKFLDELVSNLRTYTWSGSLVLYYQIQLTLMEEFLTHRLPKVKAWSRKNITWLKAEIDKEKNREQERDLGVYTNS